MKYIIWFGEITHANQGLVGGKNGSLGHMIADLSDKVSIPDGFAITIDGYWHFLKANNLVEPITRIIDKIDMSNLATLRTHAREIRALIIAAKYPDDLRDEIVQAYHVLSKKYNQDDVAVAVRSSATAEDLPTASFAGQQETYLHEIGQEALLNAARKCMASLFTERAIAYRVEQGFEHMKIGLSVGVQKMVLADDGAAGVAFSLDTETGFKDVVMINGSWGLGESVVKGSVTPDEFVVFKPLLQKKYKPIIKKKLGNKHIKMIYDKNEDHVFSIATPKEQQERFCLSDADILELSRYVLIIEDYYSKKHNRWMPQDIEWAKDGVDGKIYIVQARPETIHGAKKEDSFFQTFHLLEKQSDLKPLITGVSIGQKISSGRAHVITSVEQIDIVKEGDIIITQMTDPDWVPAMKKAAGIITDRGGRTCHAAIVSRELGIPAIVGTQNGTQAIPHKQLITLDCSQGETGYVYAGEIPYEKTNIELGTLPKIPAKILVNIAEPDRAFSVAQLPVQGVGLARLEFILSNQIGIHPMAIVEPTKISEQAKKLIAEKTDAYADPKIFFVDSLAQHIGMIAAAFYPHEVIVRLSDFKSNEYRNLIGGDVFEPMEENPMLGWRGASRYYHSDFEKAFALECAAFIKVRNEMGFENIRIMVPFVRTVDEAKRVVDVMARYGLQRGKDSLQLVMMCEIPSNVLLIEQFAQFFDGFSIGSNDLTQLTLGVDRDSAILAPQFDERDEAVKKLFAMAIEGAHKQGRYIGICGQAPSDYIDLAQFLLDCGIDSLSLNPDSVIPFLQRINE
ncbi:MAG: phosphoenolpyruvate synthase [Candidatus Dependentiae bacterium]